MAKWIVPALAIVVVSLYGALGWQHLVADSKLVAPYSGKPAGQLQPVQQYRFSFERGRRKCALPSWRS